MEFVANQFSCIFQPGNFRQKKMMEEEHTTEKKSKGLAAGRGKETLFRVAARNQIELIAIADNKANIIVGINAILISLIVALLGSGISLDGIPIARNPNIFIPFMILLVFSLVSCILAILAAKPVMIRTRLGSQRTRSILFFDHSRKDTLDEYMHNMRKLLSAKGDIYDQLMIEMYSQAQVLKRKYAFLSIAYILFMIGFISCAISAFIANFF